MNNGVMIAMSGGVDSAVAALLISGKTPAAGVTMRLLFQGSEHTENANRDADDAAVTCEMLHIPHFIADLGADFYRCVVAPFITAYLAGETPNPCVFCNKTVKFGALLHFAREKGFPELATGHYARIQKSPDGRVLLFRAADRQKDQSYMLYSLTQDILCAVRFPLGELNKKQVREIAADAGFSAAKRQDSQDICFIPDGDYAAFIERQTGQTFPKGNFIDPDGRILGQHNGMLRYTVGQRKGLGIALGQPAFVISKSALDNTVTLGDSSRLFSKRLTARSINLIPFDRMDKPMRLCAKVRYRQEAAPATAEQTGPDELTVEFDTPQRAIASGQSLVLYDGDAVIGGGIIN